MADKDPPSPNRENESLSLGRLRVKPAMTVKDAVIDIWSIVLNYTLFGTGPLLATTIGSLISLTTLSPSFLPSSFMKA